MFKYNIIIIGGGISGLMCAYRLTENNTNIKVAIIEKGHSITNRVCPVVEHKTKSCIKCNRCAIMEGMAGAGAFSDGKYVISTEYGGWLTDFLSDETVLNYIEQADKILVSFGATEERYNPNNELKKLCLKYDLHMLQAQIKHLGTDSNFITMKNLIDYLSTKCDIYCDTEVIDIDKEKKTVKCISNNKEELFNADNIIIAVGRAGSKFFSTWCKSNNIALENNQVDIGVRVELPSLVWEDFSKKIYEPKIYYRSKVYGDKTRMFCFNERGHVVTENTDGVLTVNGHSYKDESKKTKNSNFALLTTMKFTKPFNEPIEYARHVAKLSNLLSGGSVLIQRLGDLKQGKRTDEKRLSMSTTVPTLKGAVTGDLSLCMPKRQLDNIIETLEVLDNISPGTNNYDTLLYGIECKYYSARPECEDFEIKNCKGIYAIGDGAGFTRSLSQAASNGLYIADKILKENE